MSLNLTVNVLFHLRREFQIPFMYTFRQLLRSNHLSLGPLMWIFVCFTVSHSDIFLVDTYPSSSVSFQSRATSDELSLPRNKIHTLTQEASYVNRASFLQHSLTHPCCPRPDSSLAIWLRRVASHLYNCRKHLVDQHFKHSLHLTGNTHWQFIGSCYLTQQTTGKDVRRIFPRAWHKVGLH